jgi:hypothetical protein
MTTNTSTNCENNCSIESIQPEISLILCGGTSQSSSNIKNRINLLLKEKLDWIFILDRAKKHKVLPLLYFNLNKINFTSIPHEIDRDIRNFSQTNIKKNFLLTSELLQVLNFLEKNQVKAIPIKGPILSRLAYSNFGIRTVLDLDIFVKKQDFARTEQLLIKYGYKPSPLNNSQKFQQAQYYKPNTLISIDLHYEFAPKNHFISVDSAFFWQHLETFTIANQNIQIFSPEYTLIYLCLEGAKEFWRTLNRICDVSELILNQKLDWKLLLKSANELHKKEAVFLGLYLVHTLFGTPIPDDVWTEVNSYLKIKLSQKEICRFLFRPKFNLLLAIQWHLFNLQTFNSSFGKLPYLREVIRVNFQVKKNEMQKLRSKKPNSMAHQERNLLK